MNLSHESTLIRLFRVLIAKGLKTFEHPYKMDNAWLHYIAQTRQQKVTIVQPIQDKITRTCLLEEETTDPLKNHRRTLKT